MAICLLKANNPLIISFALQSSHSSNGERPLGSLLSNQFSSRNTLSEDCFSATIVEKAVHPIVLSFAVKEEEHCSSIRNRIHLNSIIFGSFPHSFSDSISSLTHS